VNTLGRGWVLVNLGLVLSLLWTAVSIVETSHLCRQHYARLQEMQSRQWTMQEQWGRLLLEQSTWAGHHRVEQLARRELDMRPPVASERQVVMP
jgi:cell division protein FtsL